MKFLIAAAVLSLCAGCVFSPEGQIRKIPPGVYTKVSGTITGKFSSTTIQGTDVDIDNSGRYVSGKIHLRHSNVYIPLIELDLEKAVPQPTQGILGSTYVPSGTAK